MAGHDVQYGKHRTRRSYSRISEVLELPNLVEIQKNSYKWFVEEGLQEMFDEFSPIEDFSQDLALSFASYRFEESKYNVDEAREQDTNYSAPLIVTLRLLNKTTGEVQEQEVFFSDFPLMTDQGSFIINGAERVIVSQLIRSPGVYFSRKIEKNGFQGVSGTVIPNRGAWLEYETDSKGISNIRIDRTRKIPLTSLVRALGIETDDEIVDIFGRTDTLVETLEKDVHKNPEDTRTEEALKDVYERLRPGEPKTADSSRSLLETRFFDPKRYDLAPVGRYKLNKKLNLVTRLYEQILAETLVDPETGEIIMEEGSYLDRDAMDKLTPYIEAGMNTVTLHPTDDAVVPEDFDVQIFKVYSKKDSDVIVHLVGNTDLSDDIKHITPADIISATSYFLGLQEGVGDMDDIDHLGNRRIRSVGELIQNQFRIGLSRMERIVRERMSLNDADAVTPQQLVNIRPVTASVKEFFGSSQLSQFMYQTNPLGELTHKRRLSALGPGGLTRDRAGMEVRDVHYSHYGRMCPIETPEGPNIGLINSLASYARINKYGFIQTPYRRVDREAGRVTSEIDYLTADEEDLYVVAQANAELDDEGHFIEDNVLARYKDENLEMPINRLDYMDVSQIGRAHV